MNQPKYSIGQEVYYLGFFGINRSKVEVCGRVGKLYTAFSQTLGINLEESDEIVYLLEDHPINHFYEKNLFSTLKDLQDFLCKEIEKFKPIVRAGESFTYNSTDVVGRQITKLTRTKDGQEYEFGRDGWQPVKPKRGRGRPKKEQK